MPRRLRLSGFGVKLDNSSSSTALPTSWPSQRLVRMAQPTPWPSQRPGRLDWPGRLGPAHVRTFKRPCQHDVDCSNKSSQRPGPANALAALTALAALAQPTSGPSSDLVNMTSFVQTNDNNMLTASTSRAKHRFTIMIDSTLCMSMHRSTLVIYKFAYVNYGVLFVHAVVQP